MRARRAIFSINDPSQSPSSLVNVKEAGDFKQAIEWENQYSHTPGLTAGMDSAPQAAGPYQQGKPFHASDTSTIESEGLIASGHAE